MLDPSFDPSSNPSGIPSVCPGEVLFLFRGRELWCGVGPVRNPFLRPSADPSVEPADILVERSVRIFKTILLICLLVIDR